MLKRYPPAVTDTGFPHNSMVQLRNVGLGEEEGTLLATHVYDPSQSKSIEQMCVRLSAPANITRIKNLKRAFSEKLPGHDNSLRLVFSGGNLTSVEIDGKTTGGRDLLDAAVALAPESVRDKISKDVLTLKVQEIDEFTREIQNARLAGIKKFAARASRMLGGDGDDLHWRSSTFATPRRERER